MGIEYVHINSTDRMPHERSSKMHVHLSSPIQRAVSVKVVNFSIGNEFFNVMEDNNSLSIVIQDLTFSAVGDRGVISELSISVPAGIYTTEQLIEAINLQLYETYPDDEQRGYLDIAFELMSDGTNRVQIVAEPMASQPAGTTQVVSLYYQPRYGRGFSSSILHRLGFSRDQVTPYLGSFIVVGIDPQLVIGAVNEDVSRMFTGSDMTYISLFPYIAGEGVALSRNIGFETHPFLFILSEELVKHSIRTISNSDGSVATCSTNILQKIPINVNLYNWIHFEGQEYTFEHELDGRTIQTFDIALADFERQPFPNYHFKDFTLSLEFTTLDADSDANKRAIASMSEEGFRIRHNCLS
jgi:hypothetical protein